VAVARTEALMASIVDCRLASTLPAPQALRRKAKMISKKRAGVREEEPEGESKPEPEEAKA
jgi:hypothetical protein